MCLKYEPASLPQDGAELLKGIYFENVTDTSPDIRNQLRVRVDLSSPSTGTHRRVRKSQFHEFTGESMSKVNSHYLPRSQWLQLPNPTARRRIQAGFNLPSPSLS